MRGSIKGDNKTCAYLEAVVPPSPPYFLQVLSNWPCGSTPPPPPSLQSLSRRRTDGGAILIIPTIESPIQFQPRALPQLLKYFESLCLCLCLLVQWKRWSRPPMHRRASDRTHRSRRLDHGTSLSCARCSPVLSLSFSSLSPPGNDDSLFLSPRSMKIPDQWEQCYVVLWNSEHYALSCAFDLQFVFIVKAIIQ